MKKKIRYLVYIKHSNICPISLESKKKLNFYTQSYNSSKSESLKGEK